MLPFDRSEYLSRIMETKTLMQHAGVDVLLVINQSNMYYLTGYDGFSDYVPQMLVLNVEDDEPRLILRKQDVPCALHSAFLRPENVIGYPEDYIGTDRRHPHEFAASLLQDWRAAGRRIGIELGNVPMSPSDWDHLRSSMPNAKFGSATGMVARQRMVKSPAELQYMREAATIADSAMRAGLTAIKPGVRECDVAARIMAAQCAGTPEFGGDRPQVPSMPSGKRTSAPHLSWTEEPYKLNTPINVELGGFRKRYVAGLSRSAYIGRPPANLTTLHQATLEGMEAALSAARAGEVCEDVEAAFRTATTRHGFQKNSRIGYTIGIDWGEGTASLQPGDRTVLLPNATYHLMLGMWFDDWGYVLSETFRVSNSGGESFAKLPRELFVI